MRYPYMRATLGAFALLTSGFMVSAADYPPPYPREGALKVLENDSVVIWNATWKQGVPTPMHEHRMDQLSVTVTGGLVTVRPLNGAASTGEASVGTVRFLKAGTIHEEEGTSPVSRRAFMLELKPSVAKAAAPAITAASFAPGVATRVLDNDRLQAWDVVVPQGAQLPGQMPCCNTVMVMLDGQAAAEATGVSFVPSGAALPLLATGAGARRAVLVLLK